MVKKFAMKTLLTIFVLLMSSSVLAEDISDFQIEGMGVGDSLLDYFTLKEIAADKYTDTYTNISYNVSYFDKGVIYSSGHRISTKYDDIKVTYKKKDRLYIIHSMQGRVFYDNNSNNDIQNCYPIKDQIVKDISSQIDRSNVTTNNTKKEHSGYPGSFTDTDYFKFIDGSQIKVACYDFSLEETYSDTLIVGIDSSEFTYDLNNHEY